MSHESHAVADWTAPAHAFTVVDDVNARELRIAAWGAVTFGALIASHSVFRPVREALVAEDADNIAWLWVGTFVAMLVLSPLWSAAIDWKSRRTVVPLAFHVFAACALVFAGLFAFGPQTIVLNRVFYIWHAVFNMFVVSVFWSLLADLLNPDTARRLFGPIAAGGTIGAFVGPLVVKLLVGRIGPEGVLVISAGLLELAVIGVSQIRLVGDTLVHEPPQRAPRPFEGIAQVARSRYLLLIAGYVLCTATAATFLYREQADLTRLEFHDRTERTEFFAVIDLWVSVGTFLLQFLVAGPLIRWLGPGLVLAVLPIAQVAGISVVVIAPSLAALVFAQVSARAITHGLARPARELMFTVVEPDAKYRAKNAIDTIGYRFGDVAAVWTYEGIVAVGGAGAVVVATVPLGLVWVVFAVALGVTFRRRAMETRDPARSVPSDA